MDNPKRTIDIRGTMAALCRGLLRLAATGRVTMLLTLAAVSIISVTGHVNRLYYPGYVLLCGFIYTFYRCIIKRQYKNEAMHTLYVFILYIISHQFFITFQNNLLAISLLLIFSLGITGILMITDHLFGPLLQYADPEYLTLLNDQIEKQVAQLEYDNQMQYCRVCISEYKKGVFANVLCIFQTISVIKLPVVLTYQLNLDSQMIIRELINHNLLVPQSEGNITLPKDFLEYTKAGKKS